MLTGHLHRAHRVGRAYRPRGHQRVAVVVHGQHEHRGEEQRERGAAPAAERRVREQAARQVAEHDREQRQERSEIHPDPFEVDAEGHEETSQHVHEEPRQQRDAAVREDGRARTGAPAPPEREQHDDDGGQHEELVAARELQQHSRLPPPRLVRALVEQEERHVAEGPDQPPHQRQRHQELEVADVPGQEDQRRDRHDQDHQQPLAPSPGASQGQQQDGGKQRPHVSAHEEQRAQDGRAQHVVDRSRPRQPDEQARHHDHRNEGVVVPDRVVAHDGALCGQERGGQEPGGVAAHLSRQPRGEQEQREREGHAGQTRGHQAPTPHDLRAPDDVRRSRRPVPDHLVLVQAHPPARGEIAEEEGRRLVVRGYEHAGQVHGLRREDQRDEPEEDTEPRVRRRGA